MAAEVTCIWTNDIARDLYERYERHKQEIVAMMAFKDINGGPETVGTSQEIIERSNALVEVINKNMRELVQHYAMPAAIFTSNPKL
jgi:hypothetical protein